MPFKSSKAAHRAIASAWGSQVEVTYTPRNDQSKKRVRVAFSAHLAGHKPTKRIQLEFGHAGSTLPSEDVIIAAIEKKLAGKERPALVNDDITRSGVDEGPGGACVGACSRVYVCLTHVSQHSLLLSCV